MTARTDTANENQDPREELLSRFSPDAGPLLALGHQIGADALDAVLRHLGPGKPHIPDRDAFWVSLERDLRNARIQAEFNGRNIEELADRWGLSPRRVRQIISGEKSEAFRTTLPQSVSQG